MRRKVRGRADRLGDFWIHQVQFVPYIEPLITAQKGYIDLGMTGHCSVLIRDQNSKSGFGDSLTKTVDEWLQPKRCQGIRRRDRDPSGRSLLP